MRIGLDYHGVIDAYPKFFSEFSKILKNKGHDLVIITGTSLNSSIRKELAACDIMYSDIFSITDHLSSMGALVEKIGDDGNPWFDSNLWNSSKAEYCKSQKIDIHIDDSEDYGKNFETPFCLFKKFWCYFEWRWKNRQGFFMMTEPESVFNILEKIVDNIKKEASDVK
jgi:hypothetical protein